MRTFRTVAGLEYYYCRSINPLCLLILALCIHFCQSQPTQYALVISVSISAPATELRLPVGPAAPVGLNVSGDWGDFTASQIFTSATFDVTQGTYYLAHTYSSAGTYTVAVDRSGPGPVWLPTFGWNINTLGWSSYPNVRLLNVTSFGDLGTTSLQGAFSNLNSSIPVPADIPRTVTSLQGMFVRASAFNEPINSWNVSAVRILQDLFNRATSFNQPLDTWDTRQVNNMINLFLGATQFNQSLNTWRTDSLTSIQSAFYDTWSFNQPLSSWNVSKVTNMADAFAHSAFNQDLSSWDVSSVTTFRGMFRNATSFNKPLNTWNTSSATDMSWMFQLTTFDQPLDSWNVSSVTTFYNMFTGNSVFNQSLGSWNTRSVKTFSNMFSGCTKFNQPLSTWNTSSATDMSWMFGNTKYNQPLGSWDVSSVQYFSSMFFSNGYFNQPLNTWDIRSGVYFDYMFFSCYSFNQPLDRWNTSSAIEMSYMLFNTAAFNQSLVSWCVPKIAARPTSFSDGTPMRLPQEPNWGTCPSTPSLPVEAPVAVMAPCAGQMPGNASCIDGRWVIYVNASLFTSSNSSVVTIAPNTTLVISGPVVATNVTIVIPVSNNNLTSAGAVQTSDCFAVQGAAVIRISNGTSITNNDRLLLVSSSKPECFNVNITTTVESEATALCAPTITGAPSLSSQPTSVSLVVIFSVTEPTGDPGCFSNSPPVSSSSSPIPVALIGGVVGGAVALVLVITVSACCIKKRRFSREATRVRTQIEMSRASTMH